MAGLQRMLNVRKQKILVIRWIKGNKGKRNRGLTKTNEKIILILS